MDVSDQRSHNLQVQPAFVTIYTNYHPNDNTLSEIVRKNWDILGQSAHTEYMYKKKLVVGYKRPKNLRDTLVNSGMPRQAGDEAVDPQPPVTTRYHLLTKA